MKPALLSPSLLTAMHNVSTNVKAQAWSVFPYAEMWEIVWGGVRDEIS